jgi:DNA-binding winged helix-turn-helix (wHTH) protein
MSLDQLLSSPPDHHPLEPSGHQHVARCDVALLRWPAQSELRDLLAAERAPRVLLISRSRAAPKCEDELEDWVREPIDPVELEVRVDRLRRRARLRALRPRVDDSGLVWVGSQWVDLPPVQLAVAQLLLARVGRVVPRAEIQAACLGAGASGHPKAVNAVISRVRRRLAELDLALTNVRARGYLLEADRALPPRSDADQASGTGGPVSTRPSAVRAPSDMFP